MTTIRSRAWRKEDFSKLLEVEPRFEDLLMSLNQQAKTLEAILNGGVGADNLNRRTVELPVLKAQTYPIRVPAQVSGRPIGVAVLQVLKTTTLSTGEPSGVAVGVDWQMSGADVLVHGLPGLSASESYKIRLEIVGA